MRHKKCSILKENEVFRNDNTVLEELTNTAYRNLLEYYYKEYLIARYNLKILTNEIEVIHTESYCKICGKHINNIFELCCLNEINIRR